MNDMYERIIFAVKRVCLPRETCQETDGGRADGPPPYHLLWQMFALGPVPSPTGLWACGRGWLTELEQDRLPDGWQAGLRRRG